MSSNGTEPLDSPPKRHVAVIAAELDWEKQRLRWERVMGREDEG
jgi:hypothetical protein